MADENVNLLGLQTNVDVEDVLSDNIVDSGNDNTVVDVETDDILSDNVVDSGNNNTVVDVETDDVLSNNDVNSNNDNSTDNSTETNVDVEVEDSFNDNSDNLDVEDSFNDNRDQSDNSVDVDIEDSFNEDSSTNVDIEDSFNEDSSTNVDVEVELNDSFNDNTDNSVRNQDSFNITSSFNTQTLNDYSTTVGVRQYQAGNAEFNFESFLGGGSAAAAVKGAYGHGGGKGGIEELEINIDNRSLQFDQSVNQVINTGDGSGVAQAFSQSANVAFGDDSIAAGGDVSIDNSVVDVRIGDVNIGNEYITTTINDSFNDFSERYELEVDVEFEDSFNDFSDWTQYNTSVSDSFQIEDSFTTEIDSTFNNSWEWENEGNIFSPGAASNGGEVETDFEIF